MQGIYTYIPETNDVPKEYNVAAILSLLFMAPVSLVPALALMYFYISTFRSMCAVPNMAVFCSSLTSWFPGMVLTYFLNDFEMVRLRLLCGAGGYPPNVLQPTEAYCTNPALVPPSSPEALHIRRCERPVLARGTMYEKCLIKFSLQLRLQR
jgi:hypothetical protein